MTSTTTMHANSNKMLYATSHDKHMRITPTLDKHNYDKHMILTAKKRKKKTFYTVQWHSLLLGRGGRGGGSEERDRPRCLCRQSSEGGGGGVGVSDGGRGARGGVRAPLLSSRLGRGGGEGVPEDVAL